MTDNALISAIAKASAHAKEKPVVGSTEAMVPSNSLRAELKTLDKPKDPMEGLEAPEIWLRATVADLTLDQSAIA
jgi:hypothetical protein